jgi:hypothetical protein
LEEFSTVDNIFKERSFKDARDAFWWSNSQISASTSLKVFIRQKSSNLAFRIEQGFGDLGFSRQLSINLLLGISNDIVSTYIIVPGNTESVLKGIGHPREGNLGFGFKFDTHMLGGQVNYMDVDGQEYDYTKVFSRKHLVLPASSGLMYWSNTFHQINRKVDSGYGSKIKGQKKEKAKAEKNIAKSRTWITGDEKYSGIFQSSNDGMVVITVDRNEKDHHSIIATLKDTRILFIPCYPGTTLYNIFFCLSFLFFLVFYFITITRVYLSINLKRITPIH